MVRWHRSSIAIALALICTGLTPAAGSGTTPPLQFATARSIDAGNQPRGIAVGDVDGLHGLDLITRDAAGTTLQVALNQGGGQFAPPLAIPGAWSGSYAAGNMDGDGRDDLILANASSIQFVRSTGGGTFAPPVATPLSSPAGRIALADLDGSGSLDVAIAHPESVSVYLNDGAGTLSYAGRFAAGPNVLDLTVADVTGDGRSDIIAGNFYVELGGGLYDFTVSILANLGGGQFAAPIPSNAGQGAVNEVRALDYDRDSHTDLAVVAEDARVYLLHGRGDGTFETPVWMKPAGPTSFTYPWHLAVLDANQDSWPDLALAYYGGPGWDARFWVGVFLNNGAGQFRSSTAYNSSPQSSGLTAADLDQDGRKDLVGTFGGTGTGLFQIWRSHGDDTFEGTIEQMWSATPNDGTPSAIVAASLRTGNRPDLVVSRVGNTYILPNRGNATFDLPVALAIGIARFAGRLNGDLLDDLVLQRADSAVVYLNAEGVPIPVASYSGGPLLDVADVSGDGIGDLVFGGPSLVVARRVGDGLGRFGALEPLGISLQSDTRAVVLSDLDRDGHVDLACVRSVISIGADSLYVHFGTSTGLAPDPTRLGVPRSGDNASFAGVRAMAAGDVDGDGDQDVCLFNTVVDASGTMTLVRLDPGRTFSPQAGYLLPNKEPQTAMVRDLDADGRGEIISSHANGGQTFNMLVSTWVDTPPHAASIAYIRTGEYPIPMTSADLDGDGTIDLASFNVRTGASVTIARNFTPIGVTPVAVSLVTAQAFADHVNLTWFAAGGTPLDAIVERRSADSVWERLGSVTANASGELTFDDRAVSPGARVAYRLTWRDERGGHTTEESWIDVPTRTPFAIQGVSPNPAAGPVVLEFTTASRGIADLDVTDITGRRVLQRRETIATAGRTRLSLEGSAALPPGLYFVRLRMAGQSATARFVRVR